MRDLIRDICGQHDVAILKGHVSKKTMRICWYRSRHKPLISRLMQWLKGPDCASPAGRVSALEEAVLASAPLG